nr:hypothetical protein [uncultured archaeon]
MMGKDRTYLGLTKRTCPDYGSCAYKNDKYCLHLTNQETCEHRKRNSGIESSVKENLGGTQ